MGLRTRPFLTFFGRKHGGLFGCEEKREWENLIQSSEFLGREVDFGRWFPVALLTYGVFTATHGGIELTTPVSACLTTGPPVQH